VSNRHLCGSASFGSIERRSDCGTTLVDRVWRETRHTGLRWFDAELQRLNGELLLVQGAGGARAQAATAFRRALAIAREQGARLYELRAATSMLRLCRGGRAERAAHAALARVYAEVTEGRETPDLRTAAACLRACPGDLQAPLFHVRGRSSGRTAAASTGSVTPDGNS
jgi:predicted ATPase